MRTIVDIDTAYSATERRLINFMRSLDTVDAHEHLPPEHIILTERHDALSLFRQYTRLVMFSAGLEESAFMRMHDPEVAIDERLAIFDSCKEAIWYSGPVRAARIALRHFYGERDVTRENFEHITEKMKKLYNPGVYDRVLMGACDICCVLQNHEIMDFNDDLMRPVPMIGLWGEWGDFPELVEAIIAGEHGFDNIDDYIDERVVRLKTLRDKGAVAIKTSSHLYCEPDRSEAVSVFSALKRGDLKKARPDKPNALLGYIHDRLISAVGDLDLPLAVHTGVWGDFRQSDPKEMIPYIMKYPNVRFDLFHMGMPFVRDAGQIGANFGNVWLNMCWAHSLSPTMAVNTLSEWFDQVAANRIIAFGGDVRWSVEKVYGHLTLAREVVATVLAARIYRGLMGWSGAERLCEMWFRDNAKSLYGV